MIETVTTLVDVYEEVAKKLEKVEKEAVKIFLEQCGRAFSAENSAWQLNQEWEDLVTARKNLFQLYQNIFLETLQQKILGYHMDRSELWRLVYTSTIEALFESVTKPLYKSEQQKIQTALAVRKIELMMRNVLINYANPCCEIANQLMSDAEKIANQAVKNKIAADELAAVRGNTV